MCVTNCRYVYTVSLPCAAAVRCSGPCVWVTGETNTDDLSPAPDAWSRPDIPLHAKAMFKIPRDGITDAAKQIDELKTKGFPLVFAGDVVGTGSSRKSATNSILWYMARPGTLHIVYRCSPRHLPYSVPVLVPQVRR